MSYGNPLAYYHWYKGAKWLAKLFVPPAHRYSNTLEDAHISNRLQDELSEQLKEARPNKPDEEPHEKVTTWELL